MAAVAEDAIVVGVAVVAEEEEAETAGRLWGDGRPTPQGK